jgi:phosphoribosyl-ATP pyrophosphohydrolase/phosphoribosyl-AMP cyclohydrolase
MSVHVPGRLKLDDDGLIPVVVQDQASGDVLMVAYANDKALARTERTGIAHFWSRSRDRLWRKGEESGNELRVRQIKTDCDRDALLMIVEPVGPACHEGTRTCFGDGGQSLAGVLEELARVIADRARSAPRHSYTARLLAKGLDHNLKKVGEEATEVILAAKGEGGDRVAEEAADLLFHLLVVLQRRGIPPSQVMSVLRRRRGGP